MAKQGQKKSPITGAYVNRDVYEEHVKEVEVQKSAASNDSSEPSDADQNEETTKILGYVRLNPNQLVFRDDLCSKITLTRAKPTAVVTSDMNTTILERAIIRKVIAKVSSMEAEWPHAVEEKKTAKMQRPVVIKQERGEQGFVKELRSNPNWTVLANSNVAPILAHIGRVNDASILRDMLYWETNGKTRQAHPRRVVVDALNKKLNVLNGNRGVHLTALAETEHETFEIR